MRAFLAACLAVWVGRRLPRGGAAAVARRRQGRADACSTARSEQLRDELVRRGSAGGLPADPATALTRLDQLEAELRRLTDRVDVLTNDVRRIVDDATNRVGDIEFRLTELEGGDTGDRRRSPSRSAAA